MINYPLEKTNIIERSLVIKRKINFILEFSKSDKNVLIYVETEAGKELATSKIHELSDRRKKPFVVVNWTNILRDLFEAELFGYKCGSITRAIKDKIGFLELAEDETIFFDEIGDVSLNLQTKLLRVIEKREIRKIGEAITRRISAYFVFETIKNFQDEIYAGKFRKDFYYRINVSNLFIPPLKERKEDILILVKNILEKEKKEGDTKKKICRAALRKLMSYDFPGNIRELENIIERICIFSERNLLREKDTKFDHEFFGSEKRANITQEQLRQTLESCHWNKSKADIKIGKSRKQFYRLLEKYKMSDYIKRN